MTNGEIAQQLVCARQKSARVWAVYAPGLPGMRQLQQTFRTKKEAVGHMFQIVAHVAAILDAADRLKRELKSKRARTFAESSLPCTECNAWTLARGIGGKPMCRKCGGRRVKR
jgi:hypothetical protein